MPDKKIKKKGSARANLSAGTIEKQIESAIQDIDLDLESIGQEEMELEDERIRLVKSWEALVEQKWKNGHG